MSAASSGTQASAEDELSERIARIWRNCYSSSSDRLHLKSPDERRLLEELARFTAGLKLHAKIHI